MKKLTVLIAMVGLVAGSFAMSDMMDDIGITLDATYMSKYLWNGYDIYDDKGAFNTGIYLDFADTGFYAGVSYTTIVAAGNVYNNPIAGPLPAGNLTEFDYVLGYKSVALEGETTESVYELKYVYHDVRDWPSAWAAGATDQCDFQEISLFVDMPNLGLGGVVPHVGLLYVWDAFDGGNKASNTGYYTLLGSGWITTVGANYDLVMDGFTAEQPEQVITFICDFVYSSSVADFNTNGGALGTGQSSGWSHFVVGATTDFSLFNGTLTPGVYYQTAMKRSRQELKPGITTGDSMIDNDLYATLTYSVSF